MPQSAAAATILVANLAPALRDALCAAMQQSGHTVVHAQIQDLAPTTLARQPSLAVINLDAFATGADAMVQALQGPTGGPATAVIVQSDFQTGPAVNDKEGIHFVRSGEIGELLAQIDLVLRLRRAERRMISIERDHKALAAQFTQLTEMAPDSVCTFDGGGNFIHVGPGCQRIWGYSQAELLSQNFFALFMPDEVDQVRQAANSARSGAAPVRFTHQHRRQNGEIISLACSLSWSDALQVFHCAMKDQSDAVQAADQLDAAEQHYRSLFDNNLDAVYSFDLQGNFVSLNQGAEVLSGFQRGELIGRPFLPLIAAAEQPMTLAFFMRTAAGEANHYQTVLVRKSGEEVHLHVSNLPIKVRGVVVGVFGIARNITEQINAIELKRLSEERFSNVVRATTDTIWDWDLVNNQVWWNEGMQKVFGYLPNDVESCASSWTSRIHADDVDRVVDRIHQVIEGDSSNWTDEYRFRRHDGGYAWVVDRGFVIRDGNGKAVRMVGGMRDDTARQQSERLLSQLNRALRMLSACNKVLIRASSEQELLDEICRITRDIGGYHMAWVGYAQHDADRTIKPVAQAGIAPEVLQAIRVSWSATDPAGRGPAGKTIRTGESTVMNDVVSNPDFAQWAHQVDALGFRSVVSLPLHDAVSTFGALTLYAGEDRSVSPEEMSLLRELADNLAYGLETRRIEEERHRLQITMEKVAAVSAGSSSASSDFFDQVVRNMTEAVGGQAGFIARLHGGRVADAQTLATVVNGESQLNFSFPINGTRCETLFNQVESVIEDDLTQVFHAPEGLALRQMRVCIVRRIDNAAGEPVGLLVVLFRHAVERTDYLLSTLRIFGARVSAEMERHVTDLRMRDQAALLDLATDAIVVRDMDGAVTFWNKGAERLYGWTKAEAVGQQMLTRTLAESSDLHDILERTLRDGEWRGELLQRRNDGNAVPVEARWTVIRDEHGVPLSILSIETDITQRKSAEHEIEHLAFYDRLTDLPNRLLLRNRLQHAMETNERSGRMGALLCIDLDHFKALNDNLGHDTGDLLLQLVAVRLSYCLRASDTVARLGGDEFIILLVDLGDYASEAASRAKMVAEKILQAFEEPFLLGTEEGSSTPSIGITLFGNASDSIDELLKRADLAMYQAKSAGRNTMQFFDPDMQAAVTARVALEGEIRSGLKLNQFLLHYQPQVDATGMPTGAEALVRWRHPQRGLVPPAAFIPAAEETGLIIPLGSWVMETACRQLATWALQPHLADLSVAVNVSARQFRQSTFVSEVLAILERTGANPRRLKLELTESLLIDSVEDTVLKMTQLKSRGVGFSLDDFGIGYSSLSYLKRLPLDQLKIDQSFVRDILTDPNDEAIARTIVALGNSLGLAVIAEGVETAEQKSRLAALGCFFYQGYYFSRPVEAEQFGSFVRDPTPAGMRGA